MDIQVPETHRSLSKPNFRASPRYIMIKMSKLKNKESLLEAAREKKLVIFKEACHFPSELRMWHCHCCGAGLIPGLGRFSTETLGARTEWDDTLKVLEEESFQPRILYLAKLSVGNE